MNLGLLGKGITYSLSPLIFDTIAKKLHKTIHYSLYDIDEIEIQGLLSEMRQGRIHGLNVTKPYKEKVIQYCDELSDEAKRIGAVNVLVYQNNKMIGHNTDGYGFMSLLKHYEISITDKRICLLGNGGSSKALYHHLKPVAKEITVYKRHTSSHAVFADNERHYEQLDHNDCDIYIQTTTLGLNENDPCVIHKKDIHHQIVIDLIYHRKTEIMTYAKASYGGLMMLLYQALKSYEIWSKEDLSTRHDLIVDIEEVLNLEFNRKSI
jgi:shikimate dehydrogenase